jgi:hypothetical protein
MPHLARMWLEKGGELRLHKAGEGFHQRQPRNVSTSLRRWHFEIRLGSPPCFRAG